MRKKALLLCSFFLFLLSALSQEKPAVDFVDMERILSRGGVSLSLKEIFASVLSGDAKFSPDAVLKAILNAVRGRVGMVAQFLTKATFFMCLAALLKQLLPDGKSAKGAAMVIHLIIALSLYGEIRTFFLNAKAAVERISGVIDAVTPILVSLIVFAGDAHTSAFITPFGAFLSGALSTWLQKGSFALLSLITCLVLAEPFGDLPLGKMKEMVKSILRWLIGSVVSIFFITMSAGGAIAGAYDGALVKGLRYAADSLIPIVGSDIAGKMESITASAQLLKSAAGVTGMVALLSACLFPAIDVFLAMWGLRALSAILECVADSFTIQLADGFAGVFSYLLSIIAACLIMGIVYIGIAVGIGKRVFF